MNTKRLLTLLMLSGVALVLGWKAASLWNVNPFRSVGQPIDQLNGVVVYYNGPVDHCAERNLAPNGYNLGIKHQCVEFVKRYYFEHLHHEMPDSFGHAREFFDPAIADGTPNPKRALLQYTNGSRSRPKVDDLLVFGPTFFNEYGHVAIVSAVTDSTVEIVQQNPGQFGSSRETLRLSFESGLWWYKDKHLLGWLRKE